MAISDNLDYVVSHDYITTPSDRMTHIFHKNKILYSINHIFRDINRTYLVEEGFPAVSNIGDIYFAVLSYEEYTIRIFTNNMEGGNIMSVRRTKISTPYTDEFIRINISTDATRYEIDTIIDEQQQQYQIKIGNIRTNETIFTKNIRFDFDMSPLMKLIVGQGEDSSEYYIHTANEVYTITKLPNGTERLIKIDKFRTMFALPRQNQLHVTKPESYSSYTNYILKFSHSEDLFMEVLPVSADTPVSKFLAPQLSPFKKNKKSIIWSEY